MAKNRSDSAHIQTEIMQGALKEILPPASAPLEDKEMPYWGAIIAARHTWTDVDLLHAVNLARTLCLIEEETQILKTEGSVLKNDRGTPVMNPRHTVLEQLSRRAVAISGKLQVHAQATMGKPDVNKNKNAAKQDALETFSALDDNLIARPN